MVKRLRLVRKFCFAAVILVIGGQFGNGINSKANAEASSPNESASQFGVLVGTVRSMGNRVPIIGANIADVDGKSVESDADGRFVIERSKTGKIRLKVTASGFKSREFEETVNRGEKLEVVYALEPNCINPYETIVRGERAEVSRVTLRAQELREVAGTMGDPFRVVMLMPGVGSMVSGLAYPVVRGSAPAATGFFLDGIQIPALFHLFLGPAVIHPDFIETVDFYPGAPPPQFGRLLGGVVEGHLSKPRDGMIHGSAYADVINAGGFTEIPFKSTGTSLTFSGRYSYTPWLVALTTAAQNDGNRRNYVFDFWDYQGRIEQSLGKGNLRLLIFGSNDRFGTESADPESAEVSQRVRFHRFDLRFQQLLLGGRLELGTTLGIDSVGFHSQKIGDNRSDFDLGERSWSARASWSGELWKNCKLMTGADIEHRRAHIRIGLLENFGYEMPVVIDQPETVGILAGAWLALMWQKGGWSFTLGSRLDEYYLDSSHSYSALEPRLSIRRKLGENLTAKAAAGVFHQAPSTLIQVPVIDIAALEYGIQKGVQLDTGFEWKPIRELEITADVYYNPLIRAVEINPFTPGAMEYAREHSVDGRATARLSEVLRKSDVVSSGVAYGFEIMVRRALGGNWFGWLSYGFQRSSRQVDYIVYNEKGIPVEMKNGMLPYAFEQQHVFNAALSFRLPANWSLGAVFHFNTGRPESGVMTSSTMHATKAGSGGGWASVSRKEVDRLPSYYRIDFRVSKSWAFDNFMCEMYLDVMNASIRKEIVGYTYSGGLGSELEKTEVGFPIVLPILGLRVSY